MPYNTRRKSLSLPSLGIQLPNSSRSPVKSEQQREREREQREQQQQHPHKRVKTNHTIRIPRCDPTPPPSPPPEGGEKASYADIDDDIVAAVVGVLDATGNRPHTVKELAIALAPIVHLVENSVNPSAIISSRLNAYLKRPNGRNLLKKELITTHPRRIYFYLSTRPRQEIPATENDTTHRSVVSPALSDEEVDDEDEEIRKRIELSPSPEVDLSSHELDDGDKDKDSEDLLSGRTKKAAIILVAPPLEGDEREFSQSAIFIERRNSSREKDRKRLREEYDDARTFDDATLLGCAATFNPKDVEKTPEKTHPHYQPPPDLYSWGGELERHLGSPESVELDELEHMLDF